MAGSRFTEDDPEEQEVIASINKMFKNHMKMITIPFRTLNMFLRLTEYDENLKLYKIQRAYVLKQI